METVEDEIIINMQTLEEGTEMIILFGSVFQVSPTSSGFHNLFSTSIIPFVVGSILLLKDRWPSHC